MSPARRMLTLVGLPASPCVLNPPVLPSAAIIQGLRPVDIPNELCYSSFGMSKERSEVLQETLDLMALKTLDAMGPQHGYGLARRIEQLSEDVLQLNEGTVYTALLRLQQRGWISAIWGVSENNRKA